MIRVIYRVVFFLLAILLGVLPKTLVAKVEVAEKSNSIDAFSMMNILNMVMGLVIVIALILGLAWVLKKYGRLPSNNLVEMKVLGGLSLGTREKAVLIEVDNTRLLVGVTPGHIQTLHVLSANQSQQSSSFDKKFTQEIEKYTGDASEKASD